MHPGEVLEWIETGNPIDRRTSFEALKLELGIDSGLPMTHSERVDTVRNAIGLAYLKHYICQRGEASDENPNSITDRDLTREGLSQLGLLAVVIPGAGSENDRYISQHEYGIIGEKANMHSEIKITINSLTMLWNDLRRRYVKFERFRENMSLNPTLSSVDSYLKHRYWEGLFSPQGLISLHKIIPAIESIGANSPTYIRNKSLQAGLTIVKFMKDTNFLGQQ